MINWIKNLWKKLFSKTEEPKVESKIDVGLQAYIDDVKSQTPVVVIDVPAPKVEVLSENINEQITSIQPTIEPAKEISIETGEVIKPKRKYTKKAPTKKAPEKKAPTKKAPTKKAVVKKTTKKNKK